MWIDEIELSVRSGDGGDRPEVGEGEGASRAGTARSLERVDGLLEHRLR